MLKVVKLDEQAKLPTVGHPGEDLGFDLYSLEDVVLKYGVVTRIRTGIAAQYESIHHPLKSYGLVIKDRSSMAIKGIAVSGGIIDSGYQNEIVVLLTLQDKWANYWGHLDSWQEGVEGQLKGYRIKAGDKIAQMIPIKVFTWGDIVEVDSLGESSRGKDGFGSTGS